MRITDFLFARSQQARNKKVQCTAWTNVLTGAALAGCLFAGMHAQAATFALGAYLTNPNGSDSGAEATFEANAASFNTAMGTQATLVDVYVDKTQSIGNWTSNASWQAWSNMQSPVAKKMTPVIGFPMASVAGGSPTPDQQFQAFASGQYDYAIQGVLQAWAGAGFKKLIFRVGWEMNIGGVTYAGDDSQSQADWVSAFKHIYTVLHQAARAAGISVQVVWNPGVTNYSNVLSTQNMYPGNGYVDIIGADIYGGMYPFSDGSGTQYHDWVSGGEDYSLSAFIAKAGNRAHYWNYPAATEWSLDGSNGHSQSLRSLIAFAKARGKPFALPEVGAGNSDAGNDVSDDPTFAWWLGGVLRTASNNGLTIAFVCIWDTNDEGNYQFSFTSDGKPGERKAWGEAVGALAQ